MSRRPTFRAAGPVRAISWRARGDAETTRRQNPRLSHLRRPPSAAEPATSQEAIELLRDAGVFPATFADTLVQMAQFRNLLVHVYVQIDIERVYDHLQNHLDDFGQFAQHVLQFLTQDG